MTQKKSPQQMRAKHKREGAETYNDKLNKSLPDLT